MNRQRGLQELVDIISSSDNACIEQTKQCIDDPVQYFHDHISRYEERGFSESNPPKDTVVDWIGMIDILMDDYSLACEVDYNCDSEEFRWNIEQLNSYEESHLQIDPQWFDDEEYVEEYIRSVNEKWKAEGGYQIAVLDIDSDSYVMVLIKMEDVDLIMTLAKMMNEKIIFF